MTPKRLKYPIVRLLATGTMASLALLAACEAKLPTSDEVDRMTASSATASAGRIALIDTAHVAYFIDGKAVSAADADKLGAERIASVNVLQRGSQGDGEVRIVTRDAATGETRVTFATPGSSVTLTAGSDSLHFAAKGDAESKPRTGFTGLMLVDGVITDPAVANSISPDQIVSVNVIKGASAGSEYSDPRAANGVIKIVTKKAKR